jgi:hypothetical protein
VSGTLAFEADAGPEKKRGSEKEERKIHEKKKDISR